MIRKHILLTSKVLTISVQTSQHSFCAVCFVACTAVFTSTTGIGDWLEACSHTNFELFNLIAHLHDHAGTLVSRTLGTHLGHLGYCPVIQHEVDIA